MRLVKRNHNFFPEFPSIFDDIFNESNQPSYYKGAARCGTSVPAVNISENEGSFSVELAAPGFKKEDFEIELDNDILTVSVQKENEKQIIDKYSRIEYNFKSFKRSFNLPEGIIEKEKISASYPDGILKIELPKRDEAKPKPIRNIKIA